MTKRCAIVMGVLLSSVSTGAAQAGPPCDLPSVEITPPAALNADAATDTTTQDYTVDIHCAGTTCIAIWLRDIPGDFGEHIYFARSTDSGLTWSMPTTFGGETVGSAVEHPANPVVSSDGSGTWIIAWHSVYDPATEFGDDEDIFYVRSFDDGVSWFPVQPLNTNATADTERDRRPRIVHDGLSTWLAVWSSREPLDGIGTDSDILCAQSVDSGVSWSDPVPLNESAPIDTDIQDVVASATAGAPGEMIVTWTVSDGAGPEDIDLAYRRTSDGGSSWTPTSFLNADAISDGLDDYGASLATDQRGHWVATWLRVVASGRVYIYSAFSSNDGATWSMPTRINLGDDGEQNQVNGKVDVVYNGQGAWLAVWESYDDYDGAVYYEGDLLGVVSHDGGQTWSREFAANTNAAGDVDYNDRYPSLAATIDGEMLVAWTTENHFAFTIGDDDDVSIARIATVVPHDCNGEKGPDPCEIALGITPDDNLDGIPDTCQPTLPQLVTFTQLASGDEMIPDGRDPYEGIMSSICVANGQVFFTYGYIPFGDVKGIAVANDEEIEVLAGRHLQASGTSWNFFEFDEIHPGGPNDLAFGARLDAPFETDRGIWGWQGGTTQLVLLKGMQVPGMADGVVFTINPIPQPEGNVNGEYVFLTGLAGPGIDSTNDGAIWFWHQGQYQCIAQRGDAARGTESNFYSFSRPRIDADGRVAFMALLDGPETPRGVWTGPPDNLQLVALEGQSAPGLNGDTFALIEDVIMFAEGHVLFRAYLNDEDEGNSSLWRHSDGVTWLVMRAGDAVPDWPGEPSVFEDVYHYAISATGNIVFGGVFPQSQMQAAMSGMWVELDTGFKLVSSSQQPAPGATSGWKFSSFQPYLDVAINSDDEVVFTNKIQSGAAHQKSVFAWTPNRDLLPVAAASGQLTADGQFIGTVDDASTRSAMGGSLGLTEDGCFSVIITLDDITGLYLAQLPDAADFNNDGVVDTLDQASFCSAIGSSEGDSNYDMLFDLNGDGTIDHLDQAFFNEAFTEFCPGDIVDSATFQPPPDGLVDGADLAVLLGAWGDEPSCADLVTGATFQPPPDGIVDGADLAVLLGAWDICN